MRRTSLLALPLVLIGGLAMASTVAAGTPPDIDAHRGDVSADIPNGGSFPMGTTSVGVSFVQYFAVGNVADGGDDLHITSTTSPAGITILEAPPATIEAGAAWGVRLRCDATSAGTVSGPLKIVNDDPDESTFTITVSCTTLANAGTPAIRVADRNGGTIHAGGLYRLDPGKTTLIRIYNEGSGGPLVLGKPTVAPVGPYVGDFVSDDVVSVNGMSMYFNLGCTEGSKNNALTGSYVVSVPSNAPGSPYTFTLSCAIAPAADGGGQSPDLPGTGRGPWLAMWAIASVVAGGLFVLAGRRRPACRIATSA